MKLPLISSISPRQVFLMLLMLGSAMLAWHHRFIQDDAFISFNYARNFAEGYGLVWYPGSDEFGYTNFLFTFLIGLLMKLGMLPEHAATLITLPAYVIAMPLVFLLTESISKKSWAPYVAAIVTAGHFSVSSYATGGLETGLHMLLVLLTWCCAIWYCQGPYKIRAWHIGVCTSLALLCRLDSAILLLPAYVYLGLHWLKHSREIKPALTLVGIPLMVLSAFLLGCYFYYGWALPNTFYAKIMLPRDFSVEGWEYLDSYMHTELHYPAVIFYLAALIAVLSAAPLKSMSREIMALFAAVALWLAYIIRIGGDFMEFRLMVAILPLFHIACFAWLAQNLQKQRRLLWIALAVLGIASTTYHQQTFHISNIMASLRTLNEQVTYPKHNWQMVGKKLGELFYNASSGDVKISVHTAGAIPYYSRLPTIDIYGLNSRWVAMNGVRASRNAGHRRIAPHEYLIEQRVNLMFPWLPRYYCGDPKLAKNQPALRNLPLLLIPLENDCFVMGYYLTPHPRIDELLRNGTIFTYRR